MLKKFRISANFIFEVIVWLLVAIICLSAISYISANGNGFEVFTKRSIDNANMDMPYKAVYDIDSEKVYNITVNWKSGIVELKTYSGENIRVTEYSSEELNIDNALSYSTGSSKLTLNWNDTQNIYLGNLMPELKKKNITIEIPSDFILYDLKVNAGESYVSLTSITADTINVRTSSKIEIVNCLTDEAKLTATNNGITANGLSSNSLKASSKTGSVSLENTIGYTSDISTISGDIVFTGSYRNLDCSSISGNITADTNIRTRTVDAHTVTGKLQVTLPSDDDAIILCKTMNGGIGSSFTGVGNAKEYSIGDPVGAYSSELMADGKNTDSIDNDKNFYKVSLSTTDGDIIINSGSQAQQPKELFPEDK
ncbi:MAG: DUF4097 family beta strand repeat-containing protein [Clostridia bacterium]|nr:DUF4097 family beta strand repeat-containing protein [Clostridia bacterium]